VPREVHAIPLAIIEVAALSDIMKHLESIEGATEAKVLGGREWATRWHSPAHCRDALQGTRCKVGRHSVHYVVGMDDLLYNASPQVRETGSEKTGPGIKLIEQVDDPGPDKGKG
jgi:hypothetical protein